MKLKAQRFSIDGIQMTVSSPGKDFCLCLAVMAPVQRKHVAKASVGEKCPVTSRNLLKPHTAIVCWEYMHPI